MKLDQDYVSYATLEPGSGGFIQTSTLNNYDYHPDDADVSVVGIGDSVFVAFDVYELVPGADRALPDSWQFVGASLSRIEPSSGLTESGSEFLSFPQRATRLYANRRVRSLTRTEGGQLIVELEDESERLEAQTLTRVSADSTPPLLGGQPYEIVVPSLLAALRGDGLDVLATRLLALGAQVRATAVETTVIESNAPETSPPRGTDVDIVERFEYQCADGGTLALDRMQKLTYNDGGFTKTEIHEEYRYTNCSMQAGADLPTVEGGAYRLDGTFVLDVLKDVVFQNYTHTRNTHEWRGLSLEGPDDRSSKTTAETVIDVELVVSPPSPTLTTSRIEAHEQRIGEQLELSIEDGAYERSLIAPLGETQPFSSILASGTIGGTVTGEQIVEIEIDPPFERSSIFPVPDAAPGVRTTGRLQAMATDGSTLTITAVEAPAPFVGLPPPDASAALDYLVDDGTTILEQTKSLESLEIPITLYPANVD